MAPNVVGRRRGIRSALFVDFDNIYSGLRTLEPAAADVFARDPSRWLQWLETSAFLGEAGDDLSADTAPRTILVRRCYLNPGAFGQFRPYFVHCGFQVVDCPAYTRGGKNGADIQMVMDVLDALEHRTRFDEFILLSGDSDFTPLLLRLRAHDRLAVILPVGFSAAAYRSACDVMLTEEVFIEQALLATPETTTGISRPALVPVQAAATPRRTAAGNGAAGAASAARNAGPDEDITSEAAKLIRDLVAGSDAPLHSSAVASELRDHFGARLDANWNGSGGFKEFIRSVQAVPEATFAVSWAVPGRFYDSRRHGLPTDDQQTQAEARRASDTLPSLAHKIHEITDVPLLETARYQAIFAAIAVEVNANGYVLTQTSRAVRDACTAGEKPVARQHVSFILKGIDYMGYGLAERRGSVQAAEIAAVFCQNVKGLCQRAQLPLEGEDVAVIDQWIQDGSAKSASPKQRV